MKRLFFLTVILGVLAVAGCEGPTPASCSVSPAIGGHMLTCPDGTYAFIADGAPGQVGPQGPQGPAGQSFTVAEATAAQCPYGGIVIALGDAQYPVCNGRDGLDGTDGADGSDGHDGAGGSSSVVTITPEPAGENCEYGGVAIAVDGEVSGYVCNGAPGRDGQDGHDGTVVCADGYQNFGGSCFKVCKDAPEPHALCGGSDWLSATQSCSTINATKVACL